MTIDPLILLCLYTLSFVPFVVLGLASSVTRRYARKFSTARADQFPRPLPILVRLHGVTVRTLRASLITNLGATAIFFGFPLLVVGMLWPQEAPGMFAAMWFWILLWVVMSLLRALRTSPDPTGGPGEMGLVDTATDSSRDDSKTDL